MLTVLIYLAAFFGLAGEPDAGLQPNVQPLPDPYYVVEPAPAPTTSPDNGWYSVDW